MAARHECNDALPHTRRVLARCLAGALSVTDFRCRASRHTKGGAEWGTEECNTDPSIVFVRRGVFVRSQEGASVVADANHILFFNPRQPYRISHPIAGGDDCTIVTIAPELAREVVARHSARLASGSSSTPFPRGHGRPALDLWWMHYELLSGIPTQADLVVEDFLLSVIDRIVGQTQGNTSRDPRRTSRRARHLTAARHAELAQAAIVAINRNLVSPPSLAGLAASLGCSSYHLSRVFREVVGSNLRSYLATARARAAADAIARGARSLTELALELGYADHSHFTNAFYKEWRVSPSAFRSRLKRAHLAEGLQRR